MADAANPVGKRSLFHISWKSDSGEQFDLSFDAVTGETKDDSVDITDHPVEEGSNVADNARDQPALLTIEGLVSGIPSIFDTDASTADLNLLVHDMDVPDTKQVALDIPSPPIQLSESGLIQAGIGAVKGLFTGGPQATLTDQAAPLDYTTNARMIQQYSRRNRGRDAYEKLLTLKSEHRLVTVYTAMRDYESMMITRVSQPRAIGDGTTAKFQVDFKQIRIVASKTVTAPKPAVVRGNASQNKGAQGTKPADPSTVGKKKSLAKQGKDALTAH